MSPQTERYLALARLGRNEWWRYALALALIAGSWLGLGFVPYALLARAGLSDPLYEYLAVNAALLCMLGGLAAAVRLVHRRPLLSLVTPEPRLDWGQIARAGAVWTAIAAAIAAVEELAFPGRYYLSFDAGRFFLFLPLVAALTPLQSAAEELVFRGYALQALGLLSRSPARIALASSLFFTAPHLLNPEVARHGALVMGANYFVIGLLLATVTLRAGRLEPAIGLHAANNLFLALFANYEGSALPTESVFTARELDPYYSLAALAAGACAFHGWMFRRAAR